jgi:hypothetical protein
MGYCKVCGKEISDKDLIECKDNKDCDILICLDCYNEDE